MCGLRRNEFSGEGRGRWNCVLRNDDWGNRMRDKRMRRDELRLNDKGRGG